LSVASEEISCQSLVNANATPSCIYWQLVTGDWQLFSTDNWQLATGNFLPNHLNPAIK
jgi:hypothetical protein